MKLEEAKLLADKVVAALTPLCERIEIAGSIRRQKAEVGDVDLVVIPKAVVGFLGPLGVPVDFPVDSVWNLLVPKELKKAGLKVESAGPQLVRAVFPNAFQVDLYRAEMETWGVILLVRTGSREHNIKLCSLARSKGLMLSASDGVTKTATSGGMTTTKVIASRSEEEIFKALGLEFVEPRYREVPY